MTWAVCRPWSLYNLCLIKISYFFPSNIKGEAIFLPSNIKGKMHSHMITDGPSASDMNINTRE